MEEEDVEYEPGCMFWAKLSSFPWWPCMIYNHPDGQGHVKEIKNGTKYHVQFFGPDVERAWIFRSGLIPYVPKNELVEKLENLRKAHPNQADRYQLKVKGSHVRNWDASCMEAEIAIKLPPDERIKRFGRFAFLPKPPSPKPIDRSELLKAVEHIPLTLAEEAESFRTYMESEMPSRMEDNPDLKKADLESTLRTEWSGFDFATKRSYLSNKLAIFGLDPPASASVEKVMRPRKSVRKSNPPAASRKPPAKSDKHSGDVDQHLDAEILRLIASPGAFRFEPVCFGCHIPSSDPDALLACTGVCGRHWHPNCARVSTSKESEATPSFKCKDCSSGNYFCKVCGDCGDGVNKNMVQCQVRGCGKWYHRDCLASQPGVILGENLERCPSHVCATCYLEDPDTAPTPENEMIQCIKCPRVFHTGELCTPAGFQELSCSHVICPAHSPSKKKFSSVPFCLQCRSSKGERVNCESCPASFHKSCLTDDLVADMIVKEDSVKCRSCCLGVQPRYAQVVWAKVPSCRWWPCEVINSRNAPINIYNLPHEDGEFIIHFIGSKDFAWVHRSHVLPFECGLQAPIISAISHASSARDRSFNRELKGLEAPKKRLRWDRKKENEDEGPSERDMRFELKHALVKSVLTTLTYVKLTSQFVNGVKESPLVHQLYVSYLRKRGLTVTSMQVTTLTDEEMLSLSTLEAATAVGLISYGEMQNRAVAKAMSRFELISENVYNSPEVEQMAQRPMPESPCSCAARGLQQCSKESQCSNAHEGFDCCPEICSLMAENESVDCGNQPFSNPPPVALLLTTNRGMGLKVNQAVPKGGLLVEYVGEVIEGAEANERLSVGQAEYDAQLAAVQIAELVHCAPHLLRLSAPPAATEGESATKTPSASLVIDATTRGSLARFVNHSCSPNAETRPRWVRGTLRLGLFALRDLEDQEEITLDYRAAHLLDCYFMNPTNVCLCDSEICEGRVLLPQRFDATKKAASAAAASKGETESETSAAAETASVMGPPAARPPRRSALKKVPQPTPQSEKRRTPPEQEKARSRSRDRDRPAQPETTVVSTEEMRRRIRRMVVTERRTHKHHEEFCYRCKNGGEMIVCDRKDCPKVYHLGCLGLSRLPDIDANWYCPWHFCNICGAPSIYLCQRCSVSYCVKHEKAEDGTRRIRLDGPDEARFYRTLQILRNRYITDPIMLGKLTIALVDRSGWICNRHAMPSRLFPSTDATEAAAAPSTDSSTEVSNSADEGESGERRTNLAPSDEERETGVPVPRRSRVPPVLPQQEDKNPEHGEGEEATPSSNSQSATEDGRKTKGGGGSGDHHAEESERGACEEEGKEEVEEEGKMDMT